MRSAPGDFVRSNRDGLGIGRLRELSDTEALVEFFRSPSEDGAVPKTVPRASLSPVEILPETRVYVREAETGRWVAARVMDTISPGDRQCHIRLPNGVDRVLPVEEVWPRWSRPIDTPVDYLATQITESPYWSEPREAFLREATQQRNLFSGMTALASAAVELFPHQYHALRRILEDPVQRYLLADEVGLGKTIEAAVLIRQHILDRPFDHAVKVIVPAHLEQQWVQELGSRFQLRSAIRNGAIEILDMELILGEELPDSPSSLIVVDEAHRVARWHASEDPEELERFGLLASACHATEHVFLLSATPALANADDFYAMLHLLDPTMHPLGDIERFKNQLRQRDPIAQAYSLLDEEESAFFLMEALDSLDELLGDDRYRELSSRLRQQLEEAAEADQDLEARVHAVRSLRAHVSETSRPYHRMVRNRRDRTEDAFYPRRGIQLALYEDSRFQEAESRLELWRVTLSGWADREAALPVGRYEELVAGAVASWLEGPDRVWAYMRSDKFNRLLRAANLSRAQEEEEQALRRGFLEATSVLIQERPEHQTALVELKGLLEKSGLHHAVLFVSSRECAEELRLALDEELGVPVFDANSRDEVAQYFAADSAVLICDARAEEGSNLQHRRALGVHLDMPLDPGRIEQRCGRIDRLVAKGPLLSVAILPDTTYFKAWLRWLDTGTEVFSRSISTLQFSLAKRLQELQNELLHEGPEAIERSRERLLASEGGLAEELERIRRQDDLDSISTLDARSVELFEALESHDDDDERIARRLESWIVDQLQFSRDASSIEGVFCYRFRRPNKWGGGSTLFPAPVLRTVMDSIDADKYIRTGNSTVSTLPMTYRRAQAARHELQLGRIGHPFLDGLAASLRTDDRGVAFAIWRSQAGFPPADDPECYFRFNFVLDIHDEELHAALPKDSRSVRFFSALRSRARAAFPPLFITVWLDSNLEEIAPDSVPGLADPYSPGPRADRNLNPLRWQFLAARDCRALHGWDGRCRGAAERAAVALWRLAEVSRHIADHAAAHEMVATDRVSILQTRASTARGAAREAEARSLAEEMMVSRALSECLASPTARLDSCGAVLMSSEDPFVGT